MKTQNKSKRVVVNSGDQKIHSKHKHMQNTVSKSPKTVNYAVPSVKIKLEMATELCNIWQEYIILKDWTPADRWISNRMSRSVFSRLERLWISGMFLAGLRYGRFALFCEQKVYSIATDDSVKSQLQHIIPENFYFWIEQRLLLDKQIQSLYRFRHEKSKESYAIIKSLKDGNLAGNETIYRTIYDGLPLWVETRLQLRAAKSQWSNSDIRRFVRRHSSIQPLWIRLTKDSHRVEVVTELQSSGFTVLRSEDQGIAVRGDRNIVTVNAYKTGKIDIQDFASQKIGDAVIARATGAVHIWDCCAGNGGKTMQIASGVPNAKIRVSDINDRKLVRIHERAVQQKCTDRIAYVPWDGTKLPDFHTSITDQGGFDIVLVDAPCSGSGTWRKNPDGRLFFEESRLNELLSIQKKLIRIASEAVRPGGWLIYGTCSFFVEENESQIESFLSEQKHFQLDEAKLCGNPMEDADTTFFAAMKRIR